MIKIISVGKIKDKALKNLIAEYHKRISHFHQLEIIEVEDLASDKDPSFNLKKEAELISRKIKNSDYVILLDLAGVSLDSLTLAKNLNNWQIKHPSLCFVIGGSNGVSLPIKERADYLWKLSDLTFPHQLVRLLLLEQLYRSFKINANQNYHK